MKKDVTLQQDMADGRSLRALADVLAPDNEGLPKGVRLSVTEGKGALRYEVESGTTTDAAVILTALLRDAALFQEVWLLSRRKPARGRR